MIKLRDDVIFEDPQSRVRQYCEIEIYQGYDDKHSINNNLTRKNIDAANELYAIIDLPCTILAMLLGCPLLVFVT